MGYVIFTDLEDTRNQHLQGGAHLSWTEHGRVHQDTPVSSLGPLGLSFWNLLEHVSTDLENQICTVG